MKNISIFKSWTTVLRIGKRISSVLLIAVMILCLFACTEGTNLIEEQNTLDGVNLDGVYEGTATITEANSSAQGEVSEMKLRIEQRDDNTMVLSNEEEEFEVIGSYDEDNKEFFYETGGEVNFIIQLKFDVEGDTITAKGTNTTNQTGEGWTQSVSIDLKKTSD